MHAKIALRKIASSAPDLFGLDHAAGGEFDACANRQTVALRSSHFQADPVSARHTMIAKNHRRPVNIFHYHVELPIIEEVTDSQAARCLPLHQGQAGLITSVTEPAILLVELEHSRLLIART